MKEKRINTIYRNKFLADLECEFCGYVKEDAFGEDSHRWYFSELPYLKCPNCSKSTKGGEEYEIREGDLDKVFLCNRYSGFGALYKEWGGGWCLETSLSHKVGMEVISSHKCAGKIREKFNKHFQENSVDGSLYFSIGEWDELVESVISKGE